MEIKNVEIDKLKFAEYNPRTIDEKQRQGLKTSLEKFGMIDPIIINTKKGRENIIIGGHQRAEIWKEMGNKTIPSVELNLTKKKEKELNIRLNKNTGSFDIEILNKYFTPDDLESFGFEEYDIFNDENDLETNEETSDNTPTDNTSTIEIFFDAVHYEEAKTLLKSLKDANTNISKLFFDTFKP